MDSPREESDSTDCNADENLKIDVAGHAAIEVRVHGQIVPQSKWLEALSSVNDSATVGELISSLEKNKTLVRVSSRDQMLFGNVLSRNQEFNEFRHIGGGAYAKVASAISFVDGKRYALKLISNIDTSDKLCNAVREVEVLSSLSHRNIVRYFSCWIESRRFKPVITTKEFISKDDQSLSTVSSKIAALELKSSDSAGSAYFDGETAGETGESSAFGMQISLDTNAKQFCLPSSSVGDDGDGADSSAEQKGSVGESNVGCQSLLKSVGEYSYPVVFKEEEIRKHPLSFIIQMEYCSTTLMHWLRQRHTHFPQMTPKEHSVDPFYRTQVRWLFDQIVLGVAYLHKNMVIHRDLKPANVLIHDRLSKPGEEPDFFVDGPCPASGPGKCERVRCYHRFCVKISDFGLSKIVQRPMPLEVAESGVEAGALAKPAQFQLDMHTTDIGTVLYTAPEVFSDHDRKNRLAHYDEEADIFSLGVIFFQMLYICTTASEVVTIIDNLRSGPNPRGLPAFLFEEWPLEAKLLARMLSLNPAERPTAIELISELAPTSEAFESELLGFALPSLSVVSREVAHLRSRNKVLMERIHALKEKKKKAKRPTRRHL